MTSTTLFPAEVAVTTKETQAPREVSKPVPNLGFGIGLRPCHVQDVLRHEPGQTTGTVRAPDWLEVISENVMDDHGHARQTLRQIAKRYPLVFHGVSLSIGSSDPLNMQYLQRLKDLCAEFSPVWISDHLCWTGVSGINSHDLLPLPLNQASLRHVISRVHQVQEILGRRLILENPSSYLHFKESDIPEWEFFNILCDATGAGILLDLNNVYVSAFNLGFQAEDYLNHLDTQHVTQVHLAGPRHYGTHIIDTHDSPVVDDVWRLYRQLLEQTGAISTLLEWDAAIPEFAELMMELDKARHITTAQLSAKSTTHKHDSALQFQL